MKPYEYFTAITRGTIHLESGIVNGQRHFFASDDMLAWYRVSHKTADTIRSHNADIKKDNHSENGHDIVGMYEEPQPCPKCGDTEHQMTATNDNTSVFCQECGHHYIDMGE